MDFIKTAAHALKRIYLCVLFVLFFISGGLALILLAPLYKKACAPHVPYRDLNFFGIWAHIYRVVWRSLTDKSYRDMFSSKIYDPPLYDNTGYVRIKESWRGSTDNCDACENSCCAQIKCPMLNKGGRCMSYGSLFFGYYYCGRYPENQKQIDRYQCPKWEVKS